MNLLHKCGTALLGACSMLLVAGCSGSGSSSSVSGTSYTATASVGDFITVTLDSDSSTLEYNNKTNGDTGTASYTVESDGSYTITDATGRLLRAFEIEDYALVVEADQTGPSSDTKSIIVGVQTEDIALSDIQGKDYNYMLFSTDNGGIEIGHAGVDSSGNLSLSMYKPNTAQVSSSSTGFETQSPAFTTAEMTVASNNEYIQIGNTPGDIAYMFATASGFLAVDTPGGSVICLEQTASAAFNTANAGTYNAMVYQKQRASEVGGDETGGVVNTLKGTITITSGGLVTIVDSDTSDVVANNVALVPLGSNSDYYDGTSAKLDSDCKGMFTVSFVDGGDPITLFVTFMNNALILCSYTDQGVNGFGNEEYSYLYGFGLKSSSAPVMAPIMAPPEGVGHVENQPIPLATMLNK